jgi:murein DD-endopeptidase MepM/ murein hydrolase activator NlpD
LKTHYKNLPQKNIPYLSFIKKYLPRLTIFIIIVVVSTNNLFAKTYSVDEYANKSLLSNLITPINEGWSELIEETGPANQNAPLAANYLEEQGALQEMIIDTPFAADSDDSQSTNTSPDDTSLVLLNPQDIDAGLNATGHRSEAIAYTVQPGDVLGKIAEQFNITVNTLLWENNLSWSSTIRPGQKLTILPNSGVNHEIKSGDTILAIANKYQTDAEKIISSNKLADASDIKIGDLLFIPNGIKPTRVVSSYQPKTSVYSSKNVEPANEIHTGTKLLWPVNSNRITQYYHWRHSGLDIGDKTGSPIYAAESGKIERAGWSRGYGYNVVINHGNGLKTLYAHASQLLVKTGDTVSRGETIALIGSTGWSTGPHLHLEVRINESRKNPLNYIR